MRRILYFLIVFLLISSCNNTQNTQRSIEELVPNNAAIVLYINSLESFESALKNSDLTTKTSLFTPLKKALNPLGRIQSKSPLLVCITKESQENVYTFITHLKNIKLEDSLSIPFVTIDSILVASKSRATLEAIRTQKSSDYSKLFKRCQTTATFSLYHKALPNLLPLPYIPIGSVYLDFNMTPKSITINGAFMDGKSHNKWFKVFEKLEPQFQSLQGVFPFESKSTCVFNYNDFDQLQRNIDSVGYASKSSELAKAFFSTTEEIGIFETPQGSGIALKSIDISATYETLSGFQNELTSFRSVPIFEFTETSLFNDAFGPLIPKISPTKFITLGDYLIFSDSELALQLTISNYLNKNTIDSSLSYETLQKSLSDEASLQVYFNNHRLAEFLNLLFKTTIKESELSAYKLSGIQLVKDDNLLHINGVMQKSKPRQSSNLISEEFNLILPEDILMGPIFVSNHKTKGKDILAQDISNNLYLISNKGVVLWKKPLKGAIMDEVEQVDLYKNGRLQLVFSTPNRIYVIDRNGENVGNFPLEFKDKITQPVAVFDYNKKRNYRFLITQSSSLLMYDQNGKSVKGFKYKSSQIIGKQPKHIRHRGKDFIVFSAGRQLKLLDRRGKVRVRVKENIDFSNESIYFYNSLFTTTNTKGELVQVNTKGNVSRQNLALELNHDITASSKTLVIRNENKLSLRSNSIDLEYGRYTSPSLFYLKDKIYVSVTDLQAKKIWLFDGQAKVFPKIPVFGTSAIDLANADKDASIEFVTKSDSNSIILYQMY
tara:strand:- start:90 stop:2414 length:2325 start_codon:yes stop_codon:yes gene_type:complete